jgi:hypothetical protein
MRLVGSSIGIYGDGELPAPERASRLLVDTLGAFHGAMLAQVQTRPEELDISILGPTLDEFADAIADVAVVDNWERETTTSDSKSTTDLTGMQMQLFPNLNLKFSSQLGEQSGSESHNRLKQSGLSKTRVQFGRTTQLLSQFCAAILPHRLWL